MFRVNNIVVRPATAEDADGIVEFFVRNIGSTSAINRALKFEESDSRAAYEQKIRDSLPFGVSVVVIDESTNDIVGGSVASVWHRDPSKNQHSLPPNTPKARHLYNIVNGLESHFWELCPRNVRTVVRGECLLLRPDLRRMKIGSRIVGFLMGDCLTENGFDGFVGATTSRANGRNSAKNGAVPLAEISYEEYFRANGIPFESAFTDGTTRAVLHFKPADKSGTLKPNVRKIKCPQSKLFGGLIYEVRRSLQELYFICLPSLECAHIRTEMLRKQGILFRKIVPEDFEAVKKFLLEHLPKASPICRALRFEAADYESMYAPRIAEGIAAGISFLAIDESTGEIVGYHLMGFFHRDPKRNSPRGPKKTKKAQILADISGTLREKFWRICPEEIDLVAKGESSCVRTDYQRRGIGETFALLIGKQLMERNVVGAISVSTGLANQKLFEKLGFVNLVELGYEKVFEESGIPFDGAFTDGTTKAVLQFHTESELFRKSFLSSKL